MSISEENEKRSQQLDPQEVGSLGKKLAQHTRSRGKLLARTFQQVRNDDSRRTTSHRKRKSRTRQNSLERNVLQNMVRMWTMDLGILLRHAESTLITDPSRFWSKTSDFQVHRDWSCSWCPRYLSSQRSWNRDSYPSTVRDNTNVWVVISRSRNRYVGELRHRESDKIHEHVVGECVQCQDEEHSQGERSEARQIFGWCRDRSWRAKRWLCCIRGIHRTRIVSLANDCCKSDGCCCEITRMRWTSRRRSISLHPGKNGGRSKVVKNSKVWMPRYMDTSSPTQVAQIFVRHRRPSGSSWTKFVRSPACWPLVERHFEEVLLGLVCEKVPNCECLFCSSKTRIVLFGIRGWHQNGWKNRVWLQCGRTWWNLLILTYQHHVSIMYICDSLNVNVNRTKTLSVNTRKCSNHEYLPLQLKKYQDGRIFTQKLSRGPTTWKDTRKSTQKGTCELANKKTEQLYTVSTLCLDDHNFQKEELETVGELSVVRSQMVLKCLYLARIGRPDFLWSVNKLALAVTRWTRACDRRLARLISYIHQTHDYRQYCHVGNTAQHCRLGLFQDSDFCWWPWRLKINLRVNLMYFGSRTCVPKSWMCKKQTSVYHSSTWSEIISLDAGLRMDGITTLDLWDVVIEVLHSSNNVPPTQKISTPKSKPRGAAGNCVRDNVRNIMFKKECDRNVNQLSELDYVTTNAHIILREKPSYTFLKTTKLWSR